MSQDAQVSFEAVGDSESGDGGVEHGALLSRLCEAMFEEDDDQLASVKDDVIEIAGADVLIDAVAVSANFYMLCSTMRISVRTSIVKRSTSVAGCAATAT